MQSNKPYKLLALSMLAALSASVQSAFAADEGGQGFMDKWLATSERAKEMQPHWITPLVTVTPRLEQEYRYDQTWQSRPGSVDFTSYGTGKGVELIPTENTEIIVGVPAYQVKDGPHGREEGWADQNFLLKYRFLSANEEQGNYIVTGFLGVSAPSGSEAFTANRYIYTPTLAFGKGWGTRESGVDLQSTVGVSIPDGNKKELGMPIFWNTALQAHIFEKFWPEIEANYTHWKDGPLAGKTQVAITTGVVAGRIPVTDQLKLIVGAGYQQPVSTFKTFDHTWVMTARLAF